MRATKMTKGLQRKKIMRNSECYGYLYFGKHLIAVFNPEDHSKLFQKIESEIVGSNSGYFWGAGGAG